MRKYYKRHDGDSGPDWIIDLDGPDGNVFHLLTAIKRVMGHEKYAAEAISGEHYENPKDCPYTGYDCVLDYILYNCPEIELRMYGHHVQQVNDYHHYTKENL